MSLKRMLKSKDSDYMTTQFLEEVCSSKYIEFEKEKTPERVSMDNWSPPKKILKKEKDEVPSTNDGSETDSPGVISLSNLDWLIDMKMTDFFPNLVSLDDGEEKMSISPKKSEKKSPPSQNGKVSKQECLMKRIKDLLPLKAVENNNYKSSKSEADVPTSLRYDNTFFIMILSYLGVSTIN